jgi:hypothetical protein
MDVAVKVIQKKKVKDLRYSSKIAAEQNSPIVHRPEKEIESMFKVSGHPNIINFYQMVGLYAHAIHADIQLCRRATKSTFIWFWSCAL